METNFLINTGSEWEYREKECMYVCVYAGSNLFVIWRKTYTLGMLNGCFATFAESLEVSFKELALRFGVNITNTRDMFRLSHLTCMYSDGDPAAFLIVCSADIFAENAHRSDGNVQHWSPTSWLLNWCCAIRYSSCLMVNTNARTTYSIPTQQQEMVLFWDSRKL